MMAEEQTTQQRRKDIQDATMASLIKVPLVGSLINKLSEYVTVNQNNEVVNNKAQATLIDKQNVILKQISVDTSDLLRGMLLQVGVLNDIKKNNKERDRQASIDKQRQAALAEEASLEYKKDAVNVAIKQVDQPEPNKPTSFLDMIGTLLKSIASLAAALIALPSKIISSFKALMNLKNAISILPKIARFFLMNPIGIGLLAGATLITLLAKDKNPEETTKSILNAGTPDTAMAEAIMQTAEAPDAEKQVKKQNLLANRPKNKKSLIFYKDSELQKDYLKEIGWDEKTGTTAEERSRGTRADVRRMDNQMESTQSTTSPAPSQTEKSAQSTTSPATLQDTADSKTPTKADNQTNATPVSAVPVPAKADLPASVEANAIKEPKQSMESMAEPNTQPALTAPSIGSSITQASTDVESMYSLPVTEKSGGVVINTNNSTASSAPKQRTSIPSPVANRGSIDKYAFSVV